MLFFGGPGPGAPRSVGHLWNLGHVALFGSGTLLVMRSRKGDRRRATHAFVLRVIGTGAALAIGSELLQIPVHRSPQFADVARDLLGTGLALAFGPWRAGTWRRGNLWAARVALLLALGVALLPLAMALLDEWRARRQFPVLGDFETALELGRWEGEARRSLSATVARRGAKSLRVDLGTQWYAGIASRHLPGDWSGYGSLHFDIYVPDSAPLLLTCRVHDAYHREHGQTYEDRFNRQFDLTHGWNGVVIDLADIRDAPRGREMDLTGIEGFGIFAVSLPAPRTFYLDDLRLER